MNIYKDKYNRSVALPKAGHIKILSFQKLSMTPKFDTQSHKDFLQETVLHDWQPDIYREGDVDF